MIPRVGVIMICLSVPATAPAQSSDAAPLPSGERRITLNVPKGDIREALSLVAQQGGLNLVIGPGVEGEVSVYLTDASLETALRAITLNNGFVFEVDNEIISVSKPPGSGDGQAAVPPLITRSFTLRSQDAARVKDALEVALTKFGKMTVLNENSETMYYGQQLDDLSGGFDDSNRLINGVANNQQSRGNTALAAGGLANTLPARNARRLIVTDTHENMRNIADLIADLDTLPPQVLVEARIVEMSVELQRELGIDWDVNVLGNGPILNHELPLQWEAGFASGSQISRTPSGTANSSAGLALGTIDFSRFLALLRVHQTDNSIRLLANPRLLVFNNHGASILVGERYPIFEATITDFGTVTEAFDEYIPVGIQLEVMPTIMPDGRISLMVHPVTSSLGDDVVGTTGLRVARILTREISTRVIMEDGQTIVLGGLISDRKTRLVNKVPGLGDLPIFSIFTRQENPSSERVDLLVFLTAQVENAVEISERDREVYEKYRPHFKQIDELQDVPLHFEAPTEYREPRPMFGDPPELSIEDVDNGSEDDAPALTDNAPSAIPNASTSGNESKPDATEDSPALRRYRELIESRGRSESSAIQSTVAVDQAKHRARRKMLRDCRAGNDE